MENNGRRCSSSCSFSLFCTGCPAGVESGGSCRAACLTPWEEEVSFRGSTSTTTDGDDDDVRVLPRCLLLLAIVVVEWGGGGTVVVGARSFARGISGGGAFPRFCTDVNDAAVFAEAEALDAPCVGTAPCKLSGRIGRSLLFSSCSSRCSSSSASSTAAARDARGCSVPVPFRIGPFPCAPPPPPPPPLGSAVRIPPVTGGANVTRWACGSVMGSSAGGMVCIPVVLGERPFPFPCRGGGCRKVVIGGGAGESEKVVLGRRRWAIFCFSSSITLRWEANNSCLVNGRPLGRRVVSFFSAFSFRLFLLLRSERRRGWERLAIPLGPTTALAAPPFPRERLSMDNGVETADGRFAGDDSGTLLTAVDRSSGRRRRGGSWDA